MDFNSKCRGCLAHHEKGQNLFRVFKNGLTLADILETSTRFSVQENDALPSDICQNCTKDIVTLYNFICVFEESEKFFKTALSNINKSEDNTTTIVQNLDTLPLKVEIKEENQTNAENEVNYDNSDRVEYEFDEDIFEDSSIRINNLRNSNYIDLNPIATNEKHIKNQRVVTEAKEETTENLVINTIKYSCGQCGDMFLLQQGFVTHMSLKHNVKVGTFEQYTSKITIKVPKVTLLDCPLKVEVDKWKCRLCKNIMFNAPEELAEHCQIHKNFVCEVCGAAFISKSRLMDHLEVHTTERKHICPICGETFRRRGTFTKHKRRHRNPREIVCETCGKAFNTTATLKTHIKLKHTNERNFRCEVCEQTFPLLSWLKKHVLRKHSDNREKNFICDVCGQAFFEKGSLKIHTSVKHSESTKVHCHACGKVYSSRSCYFKHCRNIHNMDLKSQKL